MNGSSLNKEVKKVEENFRKWLMDSNLLENDFLKYGATKDFLILSKKDNGYKIIAVGHRLNGKFERIGEQLIYLEKDINSFMDLSLLLLFMAEKLDNSNEKDSDLK